MKIRHWAPVGVLLAALVALPGAAQAQPAKSNTYLTLSAGAVLVGDLTYKDTDPDLVLESGVGYMFMAGIGYRLNDWFAIEGELGYMSSSGKKVKAKGIGSAKISKGGIKGPAFFINAIGEIDLTASIMAYGGVGAGYFQNSKTTLRVPIEDGELSVTAKSELHPAFQLKAGVGWRATQRATLAAEYRLLMISFGSEYKGHNSHYMGVALRYSF